MDIRQELCSRIIEPFEKQVACEEGWDGLLFDLHDKLVAVDPNYTICQVKEKFGSLRVYYNASDPTLDRVMGSVVRLYQDLSLSVCEKTGRPGSLKVKDGIYKTLADSYIAEGWVKVDVVRTMPTTLEE